MTEGKRIPRLQVTAQGRLVDEAIIQLIKDFEKPSYKIQTVHVVDLHEFVVGETHSPVPTSSENSAVLLVLRKCPLVFQITMGSV